MHRTINISLDDALITHTDAVAEARRIGRSALIAEALASYLAIPEALAAKPGPKRHILTKLEQDIVAALRRGNNRPLPEAGFSYQLGRTKSAIRPALASLTLAGVLHEVPMTEQSSLRCWALPDYQPEAM